MMYDLIIVSRSTGPLVKVTQDCIHSAGADNVIIVETSADEVHYDGVHEYVQYDGQFNYNRALNSAMPYVKGDIHILANNDLIFHPGWQKIGGQMKAMGFGSGSAWFRGCSFPQGDFVYEGYNIAQHLTGWCLFITREALQKIGSLREDVSFWYSDNLYAQQLIENDIRHGLFCNVRVDHIANKTLKTMPIRLQRQYSIGQLPIFNKICHRKKHLQS